MTTTSEHERVLAGVDASRRVGWAKHYATAEKLDHASRDLNVLRSERHMFRAHASFLHGFLEEAVPFLTAQRVLHANLSMLGAVLDDELVDAGRRAGMRVRRADLAADPTPQNEKPEQGKLLTVAQVRKVSRRERSRGQRKAIRELMEEFGFATGAEMYAHLTSRKNGDDRDDIPELS